MTSVELDPLGDGVAKVTLLSVTGGDIDVVNAARVSLNKHVDVMDEKDIKLLKFLLTSKPRHTSPFEHNQLRFRIKLPIFVVREWHRHRVGWSYNEVSGRYVEFGKDFPIQFYRPPFWRGQSSSNRQASTGSFTDDALATLYDTTNQSALQTYQALINRGVARELARGVLPVCTYTEMYATCNLVSLFHFLGLRLHKDAQYETMCYAKALLTLAEPHFPYSIEAWKELCKDNPLIWPGPPAS